MREEFISDSYGIYLQLIMINAEWELMLLI